MQLLQTGDANQSPNSEEGTVTGSNILTMRLPEAAYVHQQLRRSCQSRPWHPLVEQLYASLPSSSRIACGSFVADFLGVYLRPAVRLVVVIHRREIWCGPERPLRAGVRLDGHWPGATTFIDPPMAGQGMAALVGQSCPRAEHGLGWVGLVWPAFSHQRLLGNKDNGRTRLCSTTSR